MTDRFFWDFNDHEGAQTDERGVHTGWHDYVSVVMDNYHALEIVQSIARQVQARENDGYVIFNMAGLLEKSEEE